MRCNTGWCQTYKRYVEREAEPLEYRKGGMLGQSEFPHSSVVYLANLIAKQMVHYSPQGSICFAGASPHKHARKNVVTVHLFAVLAGRPEPSSWHQGEELNSPEQTEV